DLLSAAGAQQQDAEQGSDARGRRKMLQGHGVYNAVPWHVNGACINPPRTPPCATRRRREHPPSAGKSAMLCRSGLTTIRNQDHEGGVRVPTLDRPHANAIHETLLGDLAAAVRAASDDDAVRAVVLTGAGAFFSGGFDFRAARRDDAASRQVHTLYRDTHRALLALPKPTLAMMQGHAIAGGLVLVLACDYRLGLDGDYRVGLNEVAVGAAFPRTALEIVRLRLAHARASELILGAALYAEDRRRLATGHDERARSPEPRRDAIRRRPDRLTHQDLSSRGPVGDARREVHVVADEVALAPARGARVHTDAKPQASAARGDVLHGQRRRHRAGGGREGGHESIAEALQDPAPVMAERRSTAAS